jgi:hypothetical protein
MPTSFELPPLVALAIRDVPLVVGWFTLGPEAVLFGVFGATEEFEILRSVIKTDGVFMTNVLVRDGVKPVFRHHYESVNPDGVRLPTIVRGTDDVATVGEHGGMPSLVWGRFSCVSAWDVESLHPLRDRLLCTSQFARDLDRAQLLFPVEFVEE